jgi:hypothetical protein
VVVGSNGTGEYIAYDRHTLEVLLLDLVAPEESAIVLGGSLAEAFGHFERDDVFDEPKHRPYIPAEAQMPDDWRDRDTQFLQQPDDLA